MKLGWLKWPAVVIVAIMILAIVVSFFRVAGEEERVGLGTVMDLARSGEAGRLEVHDESVSAILRDGKEVEATIGDNTDVAQLLASEGIEIGSGLDVLYDEPGSSGAWYSLTLFALQSVLIGVVIYVAVRAGMNAALGRREGEASKSGL